jgi:protein ImuB
MVWRRISYRVLKASGPERIEAEWWRSGQNLKFLLPPRDERPQTPPPDPKKKAVAIPKPEPHVSKLETFVSEQQARDYFVIEDESGRRFWVFRLGLYGSDTPPRWFLHGFFS